MTDKRDPPASDVVRVTGVSGPVPLHRVAAAAWTALVQAARADGLAHPLLLPVSGYRSSEHQQRLWKAACRRYHSAEAARRWVAPPGSSAHQSGRAIDFNLGGRNDSANVAALRRLPAYRWLVANAQRFGFYPYEAEPWHWEYNPPATGPSVPAPLAPTPGGRQLEIATVPVLAHHHGTSPALLLRWNRLPEGGEIDVVVHLHGYALAGMSLVRDIAPFSGLDLQRRTRPTLAILPRGNDTGRRQKNGSANVFTFPALADHRDGLTRLIDFSLQRFATANGVALPRRGRLILTAHSGGGAPLMRILAFTDPDEVHTYDALYTPADALATWAQRHIRSGRRGAMRVFYRGGTAGYSRRLLETIAPMVTGPLARTYRVEASTLTHMQVPRAYGGLILADPAADVPNIAGAGRRAESGAPQPRRFTQLVPVLNRLRGDIPLDFLLGWIAVESDGRLDTVTRLDERGYFQIHPDESRDRHFDHQRLTTDQEYSLRAGIENVRYYAGLARRRFPSIAPGSELFWRVVKLQHALGSPLTRRLLDGMTAAGIPLTWDEIRRYEISHGPQLHRLLRVQPLGRFARNVDAVFTRGRKLAAGLG